MSEYRLRNIVWREGFAAAVFWHAAVAAQADDIRNCDIYAARDNERPPLKLLGKGGAKTLPSHEAVITLGNKILIKYHAEADDWGRRDKTAGCRGKGTAEASAQTLCIDNSGEWLLFAILNDRQIGFAAICDKKTAKFVELGGNPLTLFPSR